MSGFERAQRQFYRDTRRLLILIAVCEAVKVGALMWVAVR